MRVDTDNSDSSKLNIHKVKDRDLNCILTELSDDGSYDAKKDEL